MVAGTKLRRLHPGATNARASSPAAILVAALVLGTVWGITSYDPQAFTLRSAEDYDIEAGPAPIA